MVISLPFLLTQLISFGILAFLLYRFLYKPLSKMMRERSAKISEGLNVAERARTEAAEASARTESELLSARKEAAEILTDARATAQKISTDEMTKTKQQIEDSLSKAQLEIQQERVAVMEELRREFGSLVMSAAEKVVRANLGDTKQNNELIKSTLDEALGARGVKN